MQLSKGFLYTIESKQKVTERKKNHYDRLAAPQQEPRPHCQPGLPCYTPPPSTPYTGSRTRCTSAPDIHPSHHPLAHTHMAAPAACQRVTTVSVTHLHIAYIDTQADPAPALQHHHCSTIAAAPSLQHHRCSTITAAPSLQHQPPASSQTSCLPPLQWNTPQHRLQPPQVPTQAGPSTGHHLGSRV
jgi:hypothetical protein